MLGLRLARAGGPARIGAIVLGNAVSIVLLLGALGLQDAVYPPGVPQNTSERTQMIAITGFILVPVAVLLLAVARLSSATRDRRLASLRMLGLNPARTRFVATVENGSMALVGAALGVGLFHGLAPLVSRAVAAGPAWFSAPLTATLSTSAVACAAVIGLSVLVSAAPSRALQTDPRSARSPATRARPSTWRLSVLAAGVAALGWLSQQKAEPAWGGILTAALLGDRLLCGVAVAVVTPWIADRLAGLLVRSHRTPLLLAGRAIQAEPASASRITAGLGVAMLLVLAAAGVLGAFESTPQYRYAANVLGDGPQEIMAIAGDDWDNTGGGTFSEANLRELGDLPGVHTVLPRYPLSVAGCESGPETFCPDIFVGTCEQLRRHGPVRLRRRPRSLDLLDQPHA